MKNLHGELLPEAVRPTAEATRQMGRGCAEQGRPEQVGRALDEIAEHFFELDYQVGDLRRKVGGSDRFSEVFRRAVGLAPWRFIQECRMETAARLMRIRTLSMEDVAFLVGYQAAPPFWRLSQRWCGLSPEALCARLHRMRGGLGALPEAALAWHFWRRCARGELRAGEVSAVADHLEQVLSALSVEDPSVEDPSVEGWSLDDPSVEERTHE